MHIGAILAGPSSVSERSFWIQQHFTHLNVIQARALEADETRKCVMDSNPLDARQTSSVDSSSSRHLSFRHPTQSAKSAKANLKSTIEPATF